MASTVAYCSDDQVRTYLPRLYERADLPDTVNTTFTSLATQIVKSSREVDSALAEFFVTFNAWNHATYPCPEIISDVTTWLTLGRCFDQLAVGDRETDYGRTAEKWELKGRAMLDLIRGTDQAGNPRYYMIPNESVAAETLTFGAGGQYDLAVQEAFINVSTHLTSSDVPFLLPESVRVTATGLTQYRYGEQYRIDFDPQHRKWKLTDLLGNFYTTTETKTISYDFSLRRRDEVQPGVESIAFIGGF